MQFLSSANALGIEMNEEVQVISVSSRTHQLCVSLKLLKLLLRCHLIEYLETFLPWS